MVRASLLILGWLIAAVCLWALLVVLDVYWNLFEWQPKVSLTTVGVLLGIGLTLAGMWLLARVGRQQAVRGVSLLVCLALLGLAAYVLPPEPLTAGFFAREHSSAAWYRVGRFLVLASPGFFWVLGVKHQKSHAGTNPLVTTDPCEL